MKKILLGVSGSISAYKSADITNQLVKLGYQVDVIMTKSSTKFITPLTLQSLSKRAVHTDVMQEKRSFSDQPYRASQTSRLVFDCTSHCKYYRQVSEWSSG